MGFIDLFKGVKDPRVYVFALVVMMSSTSLCIAYKVKCMKPKSYKYIKMLWKREFPRIPECSGPYKREATLTFHAQIFSNLFIKCELNFNDYS